jgi:hypothetical protein
MRRLTFLAALALTGCLALSQHTGLWPCTTDSDCSGSDTCRYFHGNQVCTTSNYCEQDSDCPFTGVLTCVNNACTAPSCSSNAQCTPYACLGSTCAYQCTNDAQCDKGFACYGGVCTMPPCESDAVCMGYRCVSGVCGTYCTANADCSAGNLCNNGQCGVRSCTDGVVGQCGGYACAGGACPGSCSDAAGCDPGLTCSNGTCTCSTSPGACGAYACTNDMCLDSCTSDSDCAPTYGCASGKCMQCGGAALDCSQQGNCGAPGCSPGCLGGSINCSLMDYAQQACQDVVGCTYDSSTNFCSGNALCADQNATLCMVLQGCSVGGTCTGTVTPCSQLTPAQCTATAGCSLQ